VAAFSPFTFIDLSFVTVQFVYITQLSDLGIQTESSCTYQSAVLVFKFSDFVQNQFINKETLLPLIYCDF